MIIYNYYCYCNYFFLNHHYSHEVVTKRNLLEAASVKLNEEKGNERRKGKVHRIRKIRIIMIFKIARSKQIVNINRDEKEAKSNKK